MPHPLSIVLFVVGVIVYVVRSKRIRDSDETHRPPIGYLPCYALLMYAIGISATIAIYSHPLGDYRVGAGAATAILSALGVELMIPKKIPYKAIIGVLTITVAAIIGIVYANPGTSGVDNQRADSATAELSTQNASYVDSDAAARGAVKKFVTSLSAGDIKTARQLSCGQFENSLSAQGAAERLRAESNRYRSGVELYRLTVTRNQDRAIASGVLVRRKAGTDEGWATPTEFHLAKNQRTGWQVCSYRDSGK